MSTPAVSPGRFAELLSPYTPELTETLLESLAVYLEVLLRWNARTNLTAIRSPEEVVRRHFGESLFVAQHLPACETLLDFGSGAGFPGVPIQLARPGLAVTLAEAQNKKASFLRELVRCLALRTEVWGGRVETMPQERVFDVVAMRAVDDPETALLVARRRVRPGGVLALLTTDPVPSVAGAETYPLPNSERMVLQLCR